MSKSIVRRLCLVASAVAALAAVGVVQLPAASTFAVSSPSQVATGFTQVMNQGFGDFQNSWSWSMEYYKGRLYVGTNRNMQCVEFAASHTTLPFIKYPPNVTGLTCPQPISALPPTLGAQIWSVDPSISVNRAITQTDWQPMYTEPTTIPMTVTHTLTPTTGPRDMAFRGMSIYDDGDPNGPALYVSGVGLKPLAGSSVLPPALLRTTDGTHYQPVPSAPTTTMGDINTLPTIPNLAGATGGCCLRGQASITDAQGNHYFFVIIGSLDGEGAVFVSQHPDQGNNSFVQFKPPNMQVFEMSTFNGHLYVGVQSLSGGYQVLRTDCFNPGSYSPPYCPSDAFTTVVPDGGGLGSKGDDNVLSMHVFTTTATVSGTVVSTPHLYVGTDGYHKGRPAEIVRVNQDDSWDLIVGKPRTYTPNGGACTGILSSNGTTCTLYPKSGLGAGFDWPLNWHIWRMEDYNGTLYAGTLDADSLKYHDTAIGNLLKPVMGFDLWASTDGEHFSPVTLNGFGDPYNEGARTLKATPFGLFVGSANDLHGTKVYEGSTSPAALRLAPQNVQSESVGHTGAVALTWQPSSAAHVYHVYRSSAVWTRLPASSAPMRDPETGQVAAVSLPGALWVPGPYAEIGQTQGSVYVDRSAQRGGHYSYYVVAEDAGGNLSVPSNVGSIPSLVPQATFHGALSLLDSQFRQRRLEATQKAIVSQGLWAAYLRLLARDPSGSHDRLDAVRQELLSAPNRVSVENLAELIGRLEQRVALVANRVIAPVQMS